MRIHDNLSNDRLYSETRDSFYRIGRIFMRDITPILKKLAGKEFTSPKLKNSASRITVPQPFNVYIRLMEESVKFKFPKDLQFTKEEVIESDLDAISRFSTPDFNISKLDFSTLIRCSIQSFFDLGFDRLTKVDLTLSPKEAAESFPSSTSSGYPIFRPKGEDIAIEDAVNFCESFINNPSINSLLSTPTAVFHRFQYKIAENYVDLTKKIRAIWGISFRVSTVEAVFFREIVKLIAQIQSGLRIPLMATGLTNREVSRRIILNFRTKYNRIYSVDAVAFDSTIPSYMWILFYSTLFSFFILTPLEVKCLTAIAVFHNFTPYVYLDTKLKFQQKGIPSGSLITQLFGSYVSRTIVNYAFYEKTGQFAGEKCTVLGDDNLVCGDYFSLEYLTDVYKRFGVTVSIAKSSIHNNDEPIVFLGRIWDIENRPTAPLKWYIAHLALPSKFYRDLPFSVALFQTYRALSLVAPLYRGIEIFEKLVGWGDKVWLELKRQFYETSNKPIIRMIDWDVKKMYIGVPMERFIYGSWEDF